MKNKIVSHQAAPPSSAKQQAKPTATKKAPSKTVVKVVNNLKASGLTQLIGKIAKRASKTSQLVNATGVKAGASASGRALASIGKTDLGAPDAKPGKTFKVSGVSTAGKGGGSEGFRGISGLAVGSAGSANVGILEEETIIEGGLAREVISRTIERYLGEVRYCYERQLAASPDLYGKVLVKFVIGGSGQVQSQSIGSSSMNNSMVEGCMLRKVAKWKFPVPKGGTEVVVTYPFLFKSSQ